MVMNRRALDKLLHRYRMQVQTACHSRESGLLFGFLFAKIIIKNDARSFDTPKV